MLSTHKIQQDIYGQQSSFSTIKDQEDSAEDQPCIIQNQYVQFSEFAKLFLYSEFDIQHTSSETQNSLTKSQSALTPQKQIRKSKKITKIKLEDESTFHTDKQTKNKKKSKSKGNQNITKNYIFGILKYIQQNDLQVKQYLKRQGLKLDNEKKFFKESINQLKKEMYSIKHMKQLIQKQDIIGKLFRVFGYKFIRSDSFQYFHQKSFKNRVEYTRIKHLLEQAFINPEYFSQLQIQ